MKAILLVALVAGATDALDTFGYSDYPALEVSDVWEDDMMESSYGESRFLAQLGSGSGSGLNSIGLNSMSSYGSHVSTTTDPPASGNDDLESSTGGGDGPGGSYATATPSPTAQPTPSPTAQPTPSPTAQPTPAPTPIATLAEGTAPSPPPKVKFSSGVGGISIDAAKTDVFQKAYKSVLADQLPDVQEKDIALENIRPAPSSRRRLLMRGLAHLVGDADAERRLNSGGVIFDVIITVAAPSNPTPAPAPGAAPTPAPAFDFTALTESIKAHVKTFQENIKTDPALATKFKDDLKEEIKVQVASDNTVDLSDIITDTAAFDNFDVAAVTTAPAVIIETADDDDDKIGGGAIAGIAIGAFVVLGALWMTNPKGMFDNCKGGAGGAGDTAVDKAVGGTPGAVTVHQDANKAGSQEQISVV